MPTRYLCHTCGVSSRRRMPCVRCGGPAYLVEVSHTIYGVLMYVFAGVGGLMLLAAIAFSWLLILLAFVPLAIAVLLNVIDDRKIDQIAASVTRR